MSDRSDRYTTIRLLIYPPLGRHPRGRWSINLCRHDRGRVVGSILASGDIAIPGPEPTEREVLAALESIIRERIQRL